MSAKGTQDGSASKTWDDLPQALGGEKTLDKLNASFKSDGQYQAFTTTNAITRSTTFGIKSAGNDHTIMITVNNGSGSTSIGHSKDASFTLSALPF